MLSIPHMIVVFVIVLVVFGPQKLPELARGLGKLMAEFRKASTDFKSAFEEEMRDLERQAREVERRKQELLAQANAALQPQPATFATPSGVETQPTNPELASESSAGAETPTSEAGATEATPPEGPVVAPVAESTFARESGASEESEAAEQTDSAAAESAENHDLEAKAQRAATDN
jgi:sec-independent protein translocase protein TatB